MVLILVGNSEIGAHVLWSKLCYLICLRHLIRSRAIANRIFFLRKDFMRAHHVMSYHLSYVPLAWLMLIVKSNFKGALLPFILYLLLSLGKNKWMHQCSFWPWNFQIKIIFNLWKVRILFHKIFRRTIW